MLSQSTNANKNVVIQICKIYMYKETEGSPEECLWLHKIAQT